MTRFAAAIIISTVLIGSFAFAQDSTPKVQVFGGYSLAHEDTRRTVASDGRHGRAPLDGHVRSELQLQRMERGSAIQREPLGRSRRRFQRPLRHAHYVIDQRSLWPSQIDRVFGPGWPGSLLSDQIKIHSVRTCPGWLGSNQPRREHPHGRVSFRLLRCHNFQRFCASRWAAGSISKCSGCFPYGWDSWITSTPALIRISFTAPILIASCSKDTRLTKSIFASRREWLHSSEGGFYGNPKAYTALPAAIATYSLPSTAKAIGAA